MPRIIYSCSMLFYSSGLRNDKKNILSLLQTVQRKVIRVIISRFKATSLQALDIKTFLFFINFRLDKLGSKLLLRIASSQLYEIIINQHPKPAQLKQLSSLKNSHTNLRRDQALLLSILREKFFLLYFCGGYRL